MRLCLFFYLFQACLSYKFLVYSPLFGHSHTTFMAKIADTLTAAGHEVTFLEPIMDRDLVGRESVTLTKDVVKIDGTPRIHVAMRDIHDIVLKAMWELSPDVFGMLQMIQNVTEMSEATCQHVMNQDELFTELRKRKYDVGILEPTSICGFGVFEHLGIPATIGAISAAQIDIISYHLGEPLAPSYVPSMSGADGDQMGLLARANNLLGTVAGFKFVTGILEREGNIVKKKLGDKWMGIGNLIAKSSFMFTNANPYLNYPRPLIHKTVEIGGITINAKNPGKVDEKWDKVLNERTHNVFISFGSVAKSSNMPELWKKSILEVCASMSHVTFIWKYEIETDMADHIPNLHLSPWLPQNALLADKRLSVFITHGGLGSITEVAHIGKPAIVIPLFADQPRNAEMLARQGGAIALHKQDLAKPEILKKTIETVLNDDKYAKAATRLANILKEQPFTPSELVVKHSEFVAKFGSLPSLDPYGRHLSFVEYFFIDVIALFLLFVAVILGLVFLSIRWTLRKVCGSQKTKKE